MIARVSGLGHSITSSTDGRSANSTTPAAWQRRGRLYYFRATWTMTRSIARRFLAVLVLGRPGGHFLGHVHPAGKILELESGIVGAQTHGTGEIFDLVAERAAPDHRAIGRNRQLFA